ncbi:MAG: hypothetical protein ACLFP1_09000 [Candidatus Goldiibacteriota bacterium]
MFIYDMLFVLALALLFSALFTVVFKRRGPWGSFMTFFLVLFFVTWAIGLRMIGFGPYLFGVINWFPFLFVGLIFALILASLSAEGDKKVEIGSERAKPFNVYFWLLVVLLVISIIAAYVWPAAAETAEGVLIYHKPPAS